MPVQTAPQHGHSQIIGATAYTFGSETVNAGATVNTGFLPVDGLANVTFWVLMTAGGPGGTVAPQFAYRQIPQTITTDWQPIAAPVGLVLNVPTLLTYRFAVRQIRLSFTAPAGAGITVTWAMSGSQA